MAALTPSMIALNEQTGVFEQHVFPLVAQSVFSGVYLVVFAFAMYCMSKRPIKSRSWLTLLTIIIVLFGMSVALFAQSIFNFCYQVQKIMLGPNSWTTTLEARQTSANRLIVLSFYVQNWFCYIEYLIGDAIVIWRTWVLWKGSWPCVLPIVLWMASLGMLITERTMYITTGQMDELASLGDGGALMLRLTLVSNALSVATNAVSTAMIAWKAWQYRKFMKENVIRWKPTKVQQVFSLLTESGLVYLCFWGLNLMTNIETDSAPMNLFLNTFSELCNQVVGLYPTLIVALVELQCSVQDQITASSISLSPLSLDTSTHGIGNTGSHAQHSDHIDWVY